MIVDVGPGIDVTAGRSVAELIRGRTEFGDLDEAEAFLSGVVAPTREAATSGIVQNLAWTDDASRSGGDPTLESLIATGNPAEPPPPGGTGDVVILTSGTTGTPKGATRGQPRSLAPIAAILSRIPFRARETTYVAAPVYHAWGLGISTLTLGLGSTLLMRRRFDPEATLISLAEHRATALTVVPVLLQRILSLGPERISEFDLSALRIIASSGSQLGAALATSTLETFGVSALGSWQLVMKN